MCLSWSVPLQVRADEPHDLDTLARSLGIPFEDSGLLRLAFTHSSYANENPGVGGVSNERLEFLGDALVGLVVAERAYTERPAQHEGDLTSLRAALVQDETLARVARSLDLGRFMLMGLGEDASGGRERTSNLAALFEALAGAVFLDQGFEAARGFTTRALSAEMGAIPDPETPKSPKSLLQEALQAQGFEPPTYRVVGVEGAAPRAHVHRRGGGGRQAAGPGQRPAQGRRRTGGRAARARAAGYGGARHICSALFDKYGWRWERPRRWMGRVSNEDAALPKVNAKDTTAPVGRRGDWCYNWAAPAARRHRGVGYVGPQSPPKQGPRRRSLNVRPIGKRGSP